MSFTDIFIRRPVLAIVVSLVILVLGLKAFTSMTVRQYPLTQNAVVTITTAYPGASPETIAGFITTPIEKAVAQASGIDYMTSSSSLGVSQIFANLRLNQDTSKSLAEIITQVNSVRNQMPTESQASVISLSVGETFGSVIIAFTSKDLPANKISDYLIRVVQPQIQAVEGVQQAQIMGEKRFAVRVWLKPEKLAAYGLSARDVSSVLVANNYLSALGQTKGEMVQLNLLASTNMESIDEFKRLIIRESKGGYVRLSDVADVELGAENYTARVLYDGEYAVIVSVQVAPSANVLDVANRVKALLPQLQKQLPEGLSANIAYDASKYINNSIEEVESTLAESILIVVLVIFAFLGSPRAVFIPVITIPLSLIGTGIFMLMFGFTINILTLLALVLAIGLVVDDAIIVVENVSRHLEEGKTPLEAALQGARELANPIIAMTLVLVAVFVPIGFMGGLTGALFTEFAFTLVGAVVISAINALTLSPMMASRMLRSHHDTKANWERKVVSYIDEKFDWLHSRYQRVLHATLNELAVVVVFAAIILGSIYGLFVYSKSELAPQEDQGFIIGVFTPSPTATLDQNLLWLNQAYGIARTFPEVEHIFQVASPGQTFAGMVLKPWADRSKTATQLQQPLQQKFAGIAGVKGAAFQPSSLPGPRGLGVQFAVLTTEPFEKLNVVQQQIMDEALKSGLFMFMDSDLKFDQPQVRMKLDRDKIASYGLTMSDVGGAMSSMLGGGYVNYFSLSGRAYQVVPQVERDARQNFGQLSDFYIKNASGTAIPLSAVATFKTEVVPESLNHFQQQNAATINAIPRPGVTSGEALTKLQQIATKVMPSGYRLDYGGMTRQQVQESSSLTQTFFFALIIIFLTLAALFESFRDPLTILISVPMSIFGALLFITLGVGGASLNIYTEVGLVTLIGLISKHGILIVRFANDLQAQGLAKRQAIEEAAAIRLRPILMTTAAMVLGVVPLIMASGAGAAARFNLGLVIASGLSIGTLFTLFVVPSVYLLIGQDHNKAPVVDEPPG
ncbi:efflux RND transporter permease subunit [Rhizomicrobium electricum]|uniref:Efflux RND transporter permease subunit n=1 Tax=Rhizomicrobium electricum TaxID=480070 RepID=A0ABN1EV54_9PROT|nr:efflux RND transporter permease subunit [Rhizomicrobium electricum]NIJ49668.1 multidrug efflux pump [Rhizomicrobium electricum]